MSLVSDVLNVVGIQLQDATGVKWTSANCILYFNLASKEICTIDPTAYSQVTTQTLVAGAAQPLASNVINLLDVTYNMGVSGTVRDSSINQIDRETMYYLLPNWASYPASLSVSYAIVDSQNPRYFYVFPPNTGGQIVELLVAEMPPLATSTGSTVYLDDSYFDSYVDYIVARSLMEETTVPASLAKGQAYMQKFLQGMGIKLKVSGAEVAKEENREPNAA